MENKFLQFRHLVRKAREDASVDRIEVQLRLLPMLVSALTDASALQFHTLFAQISYLVSRHDLPGAWAHALHLLRREAQRRELADSILLPLLESGIDLLLHLLRKDAMDPGLPDAPMPGPPSLPEERPGQGRREAFARIIVTGWDPGSRILKAIDEESPSFPLDVHYAEAEVNEIFAGGIEYAIRMLGMPLVVGLADITYREPNQAIPKYIVLLPDLLVPVTEISGMFPGRDGPSPANLPARFIDSGERLSQLRGNVANRFLDELVRDPSRPIDDLIRQAFRAFPIPFSRLDDRQTRQLIDELRQHGETIRSVVGDGFRHAGIERTACQIEPSYFSPRFGLKGRLDLLHEPAGSGVPPSIIELKSGSAFRPNQYKLGEEHYRQILLYDLLIRSTGSGKRPRSFILYSKYPAEPLRYAAPVEAIQQELIDARNQLVVLLHWMIRQDAGSVPDLFAAVRPEAFPGLGGFKFRQVQAWADIYESLPADDKAYLRAFAAFIGREYLHAAVGRETGEGAGGLAGTWLDPVDLKEARYELLRGLTLTGTRLVGGDTLVLFARSESTHPLANFREGDIVLMYPHTDDPHPDPTRWQLYRASVVSIDPVGVVIRLRNPQVNTEVFAPGSRWNLEPDMLDSNFDKLYQSLWQLMTANAARRAMVLGRTTPGWVELPNLSIPREAALTPRQQTIFEEGIRAQGIYLLWGPPGTGKTSVMLRQWVRFHLQNRPDRILLLAYTNRAVDEICAAIDMADLSSARQYIRIGSHSGTGEPYRARLLEEVIAPLQTRREIRHKLEETRVYVGTIASMLGKPDLFDIIRFDLAIVDEASQLLEPSITGLLTRVPKAILIGDHMQLPAVSQQSEAGCITDPDSLLQGTLGITDLRMSYFERLYRSYARRGADRSIGTLIEQGRMHQAIMKAANDLVYASSLTCLDPGRQQRELREIFTPDADWHVQDRILFIPVPGHPSEVLSKTALGEASVVVSLLAKWKETLRRHSLDWDIGVITPFRAQIAAILRKAHEAGIPMDGVTVDTVERYQGGARDIIILSAVAGDPVILDRIVSLGKERVDRKLNVALTRAREQFILVGDPEVLGTSEGYARLIAHSVCRQGVAPGELPT